METGADTLRPAGGNAKPLVQNTPDRARRGAAGGLWTLGKIAVSGRPIRLRSTVHRMKHPAGKFVNRDSAVMLELDESRTGRIK
jgi:hypothetical protein